MLCSCSLSRSEILSNNRIHEHDGYSSSDDEINDKDSTQQNEEANQQNSIDGTVEESQAWFWVKWPFI